MVTAVQRNKNQTDRQADLFNFLSDTTQKNSAKPFFKKKKKPKPNKPCTEIKLCTKKRLLLSKKMKTKKEHACEIFPPPLK